MLLGIGLVYGIKQKHNGMAEPENMEIELVIGIDTYLLAINNSLMVSWLYCGDTIFETKTATLPITYKTIYSFTVGIKQNTAGSVNIRIEKLSNSSLKLYRARDWNVTGWINIVGI